jgi:hypothetical protein
MMKIFRTGAVFAALLILAACAAQPVIPYDHTATQANKKIGLLTVGWPAGPVSFLASDPGKSFGLIGALVDAGMQSERDGQLSNLLTEQNVDAQKIFVAKLTASLQAEGYGVVSVSVDAADKNRIKYLKKYPAADANGVDSYLDVAVINYGYVAAGISSDAPYRPWLNGLVKLVKVSDGSTLMQDSFTYNSLTFQGNANVTAVTISPDPAYAFPKWADATSDKSKAAAGVSDAAEKSASAVADLLK